MKILGSQLQCYNERVNLVALLCHEYERENNWKRLRLNTDSQTQKVWQNKIMKLKH